MIGQLGFAIAYTVLAYYVAWGMVPRIVKRLPGITNLAYLIRVRRLLRLAQFCHFGMLLTVLPMTSERFTVWTVVGGALGALIWISWPPAELRLRILELTARAQFTEDSPAWPPPS